MVKIKTKQPKKRKIGKYANESNPHGKYKIGTTIKITGQKIKVANGNFQITKLFPKQSANKGDSYFLYKRVLKNKKLSKNIKRGLRGDWGSILDKKAKITE